LDTVFSKVNFGGIVESERLHSDEKEKIKQKKCSLLLIVFSFINARKLA
jgi:hypothetical protein